MDLVYRKANFEDAEVVFTAIHELLDKPLFSLKSFEAYWLGLLSGAFGRSDVWLAIAEGKICAYILANYYPMPRYLGQGVELEEVVTLPAYQRKGIGKSFIQYLFEHYGSDSSCRKVSIKTDDHAGSGKLYATLFGRTDMEFYHKYLNKI
jgi:GNAT superfamily N-acetyltransferase